MHIRLLIRFTLLAIGFALTTYGILGWHQLGFAVDFSIRDPQRYGLHPIYMLILGLALIPPSVWEIFVFETAKEQDTLRDSKGHDQSP
ncbi:MAG: hypothetical protein AAF541_08420 [Pseudomonadota bacterium]